MFFIGNVELPMQALRIAVALAGTIIGAYFDLFNKKNVPEAFLYAFIAVAFLINLVAYGANATMYGIGAGAIVFAAFYLLYKFGQIGGADVFIMASIALLLPAQPTLLLISQQPSLLSLPFMLNLILASGISFMAYMLLRSFPVAIKALGTKGKIGKNELSRAFLIVFAFAVFSYFAISNPLIPSNYYIFITAIVLLSLYFTIFRSALNDSMVEYVSSNKVEVEDIIPTDRMDKKLAQKLGFSSSGFSISGGYNKLVDAQTLAKIKKLKSKVPVYSHLPPFVPHILIGLIATLLFGNILLVLGGF
ncbi:hypothetical protein COU37_05510 [Candidatus Micrarchaeota archaeon CG10_big_fil_rev_8_21_14_0_10_45_29]|nr:MAG: hypothetical protein COU37_05510 [Candidatus Micrarchaeota archaeon CG10_big_fil_rev_8_21_14_0_10_45_29]